MVRRFPHDVERKQSSGRFGVAYAFCKQWTAYREVSGLELANILVAELLERIEINPNEIQQVVYGQVVTLPETQTLHEKLFLEPGMPRDIDAYSVSRACATSYQSTISVAESIMSGAIDVGLAGGSDSASQVPITVTKRLPAP